MDKPLSPLVLSPVTCLGQSLTLAKVGNYSWLVANTYANPHEDRALRMFYSCDLEGGSAVKASVCSEVFQGAVSLLALPTPLVHQDGIPSSAPLLELQQLCGNVLQTGMEESLSRFGSRGSNVQIAFLELLKYPGLAVYMSPHFRNFIIGRFTDESCDLWARLILPCTVEHLEFLLRSQWCNTEVNLGSGPPF